MLQTLFHSVQNTLNNPKKNIDNKKTKGAHSRGKGGGSEGGMSMLTDSMVLFKASYRNIKT